MFSRANAAAVFAAVLSVLVLAGCSGDAADPGGTNNAQPPPDKGIPSSSRPPDKSATGGRAGRADDPKALSREAFATVRAFPAVTMTAACINETGRHTSDHGCVRMSDLAIGATRYQGGASLDVVISQGRTFIKANAQSWAIVMRRHSLQEINALRELPAGDKWVDAEGPNVLPFGAP